MGSSTSTMILVLNLPAAVKPSLPKSNSRSEKPSGLPRTSKYILFISMRINSQKNKLYFFEDSRFKYVEISEKELISMLSNYLTIQSGEIVYSNFIITKENVKKFI